MKRWSKLQKQIYNLRAPGLNLQIHCSVYRAASPHGNSNVPRYWISLDKEIIWDFPKQFLAKSSEQIAAGGVSDISALLRDYIDTPKNQLADKVFVDDLWGLVDILRAADRRLGAKQLEALKVKTTSPAAKKVIQLRQTAKQG
jgi:hypothetical protein